MPRGTIGRSGARNPWKCENWWRSRTASAALAASLESSSTWPVRRARTTIRGDVTTRLIALCAPLATIALACGGGQDATAKELADLRAEIVKVRADTAVLGERLDAIEIARGGYRGGAGAPAASAAPEDRPALDVVRLGPPSPDADPSGSDDTDAGGPRPLVKSSGGAVVVEERAGGGKSSPAAQKEYDDALALARARSWDRCLEAFAGFLVRYPDHPNADNATYWRGECLLGKGDSKGAVQQLEAVVAGWPKGNKAPDALYKLVQTYVALGDLPRAEQAKKKLLTSHPQSEAAKKLRSKAEPSKAP